ncbi:hypothetical protein L6164_006373 [Bauhinia variegata]|uniref:Uncharacterized protein n=1 Tax=Bauhinia variegata TaxID=167791 RepID=A0ACB9PU43_BAUVA|nr:hypothetical protein L6164_006373 [Bauhinia variegata]
MFWFLQYCPELVHVCFCWLVAAKERNEAFLVSSTLALFAATFFPSLHCCQIRGKADNSFSPPPPPQACCNVNANP